MAVELNLTLDRKDIARFRTLLKANRTMAAKSLTFVAEKAQTGWRAGNSIFHRRNTWLDKGVRIKHATAGNLVARVGSIDKFFARHVKGMDQPKVAAGKSLFVPAIPIEQQGTHARIRAMLRRASQSKTPTFRVRDMILRRQRGKGNKVKLLGVLRKEVNIEPRFDARGIVEREVREHYPTIYSRLLIRWSETGKG